jgi:hypothetical protein
VIGNPDCKRWRKCSTWNIPPCRIRGTWDAMPRWRSGFPHGATNSVTPSFLPFTDRRKLGTLTTCYRFDSQHRVSPCQLLPWAEQSEIRTTSLAAGTQPAHAVRIYRRSIYVGFPLVIFLVRDQVSAVEPVWIFVAREIYKEAPLSPLQSPRRAAAAIASPRTGIRAGHTSHRLRSRFLTRKTRA